LRRQDDEEIHGLRAERHDLRAICQKSFLIDSSKGPKLRTRADRSLDILVHAGSRGDLARDSALAPPAGRALTKGLSEQPA